MNPSAPYVIGSDTSEAAAHSIAEDAGQLREFVFSLIEKSGAGGLTCDEVERSSRMRHQTASARIRELVQKGRVVDSTRRRPTCSGRMATVWIEAPASAPPPIMIDGEVNVDQPALFAKEIVDPEGASGLVPLRNQCLACCKCDLHRTRKQAVFGEGNPDNPPIAFIGEAPGSTEDRLGRPFVGAAGKYFDRILVAMKIKREDVYILNACACRPPDNRTPSRRELDACFEFVVGQLRAVRPKVIVTLGGSALSIFSGGKPEITKLRGKWLEWEKIPVMPTFHPSYLLRNECGKKDSNYTTYIDLKKSMWSDLQQVLYRLNPSSEAP